jgi:hypothetical protein
VSLSINREKEVTGMFCRWMCRGVPDWPVTATAVVVMAALCLLLGGHVDALKAAGLAGGSAIGGVAGFFTSVTQNLVWLGVTVVGFAIVLIAILFLSGHSRAHDIALKVGVGVFLLIAAPGIVA